MGLDAFAAFHAQTRMSTIPLLPPDRSHICMALGSALWAQAFAGSGVGAAAAGSDAAGSEATAPDEAAGPDAAGAEAAVPDDAAGADPAGAVAGVPDEQAANSRIAVNASAGNRTWYRIPCLLHLGPDGNSRTDQLPCAELRTGAYTTTSNRVRTFVCAISWCTIPGGRDGEPGASRHQSLEPG